MLARGCEPWGPPRIARHQRGCTVRRHLSPCDVLAPRRSRGSRGVRPAIAQSGSVRPLMVACVLRESPASAVFRVRQGSCLVRRNSPSTSSRGSTSTHSSSRCPRAVLSSRPRADIAMLCWPSVSRARLGTSNGRRHRLAAAREMNAQPQTLANRSPHALPGVGQLRCGGGRRIADSHCSARGGHRRRPIVDGSPIEPCGRNQNPRRTVSALHKLLVGHAGRCLWLTQYVSCLRVKPVRRSKSSRSAPWA